MDTTGVSLFQTWSEVLTGSFKELWNNVVVGFVPSFLVALIIFVLGWLVASVLGAWVSRLIKSLQLDKALQGIGVDDVVSRSGFRLNSGAFIGGLVKWFIIFVFLKASLDILHLNQVNAFIDRILGYLPQVFIATLILVLAAVVADALQKVISGSARAVGSSSAQFFGGVAKWSVWILAIFAALTHLGIAGDLISVLFTGVITMLSIAGGLAFGLGGKDAAARYLEKLREDISSKH